MTLQGYVKHWRKTREWRWRSDPNAFSVFWFLVESANFKDADWREITLKRGQLFTSRDTIGEVCGLSRQQVKTALEKLRSTGEITTEPRRVGMIVTVCNYDRYNATETGEQPAGNPLSISYQSPSNPLATSYQSPSNPLAISQQPQRKNDKKDKKKKNEKKKRKERENEPAARDFSPDFSSPRRQGNISEPFFHDREIPERIELMAKWFDYKARRGEPFTADQWDALMGEARMIRMTSLEKLVTDAIVNGWKTLQWKDTERYFEPLLMREEKHDPGPSPYAHLPLTANHIAFDAKWGDDPQYDEIWLEIHRKEEQRILDHETPPPQEYLDSLPPINEPPEEGEVIPD